MKMHAHRWGEQTWRRKRRDEGVLAGLSALSSVLALPLYYLLTSISWVLSLCLRPSLSLLVFWSLSSLFFSVFFLVFFCASSTSVCFLFFTLYPFSFASSPLCFFFLFFSCYFSSLFSVFFFLSSRFLFPLLW